MAQFSFRCSQNRNLCRLQSMTLTVHHGTPLDTSLQNIATLLAAAPLERFHIYSTDAVSKIPDSNDFWDTMINNHGRRLKRISLHRMLVSFRTIKDFCSRCPNLEQLFVVVEQNMIVSRLPR